VYSERDLEGHLPGINEVSAEEENAAPTVNAITSAEQVVVSDYQLNEALNLLKGWNIMERGRQRTQASP
jgi:carboxyl-terminal processing protease